MSSPLPCPICDGSVTLHQRDGSVCFDCSTCGSTTTWTFTHESMGGPWYAERNALAIARWNRRRALPSGGDTPLSDKRRNEVLQGFIGFIGHGENSRGAFPTTLTELSDDARDYVNLDAYRSFSSAPTREPRNEL